MRNIIMFFAAALTIAGCATAPERASLATSSRVVATSPQPIIRQAQPARITAASPRVDPALASLKPGPTYVASFPEADRRAACERLKYQEGTTQFSRCLEGYFPDNPYLQQASN